MKTIQELTDRGLEIIAEVAKLGKELKVIEATLRTHAELHSDEHVPLKDDEREGRKYLARGTRLIVPVVFTADKLIGSFQAGSKECERIVAAVPAGHATLFGEFFKPWSGYENRFDDGQKFRTKAAELLGTAAPGFITACLARDKDGLPKSDVKIEWKQAAAEAKLAEVAA